MTKNQIIIAVISLFSISGISQELVQWRGTDRNGIYNEKGLLKEWPAEGPKLNWSIDGLGQGFTSVTVLKDKLYTTGIVDGKGLVFCIGMNGKLIWKKSMVKIGQIHIPEHVLLWSTKMTNCILQLLMVKLFV